MNEENEVEPNDKKQAFFSYELMNSIGNKFAYGSGIVETNAKRWSEVYNAAQEWINYQNRELDIKYTISIINFNALPN